MVKKNIRKMVCIYEVESKLTIMGTNHIFPLYFLIVLISFINRYKDLLFYNGYAIIDEG